MTPDAPVLVQYADAGAGFALDPALRRDTRLQRFVRATEKLLTETVTQPPVPTGRHVVWSLVAVDVPDVGSHWCFALQGRGGPYGPAGTCQFAFASFDDRSAAQLWQWCTTRIDAQGFVAPHSQPAQAGLPPAPERGRELVRAVLTDLANGRTRIDLGGSPRDAALALARLLPVLPPSVIARYLWSTCLLAPPYSVRKPVVAAAWPEDLRVADERAAARVDTLLGSDDPTGVLHTVRLSERRQRAIAWLAEDITSPHPSFKPEDTRDVAGLLDLVVSKHLPVVLAEVPKLLADPEAVAEERLARSGAVVRAWTGEQPAEARTALMDRNRHRDVTVALFDGLWELLDHDRGGELAVPPAAEPLPGWHERLGELINDRFPEHADLRGAVWSLRREGGPLASGDALVEAREWLIDLGLDAKADKDLLPFPTQRIVARIIEHGRLLPADRLALLALDRTPQPELDTIMQGVGTVSPAVAADLVEVLATAGADEADTVGAFAGNLLDHSGSGQGTAEWFAALVRGLRDLEVPPDDVVRWLLRVMLGPLVRRPELVLPPDVVDYCRLAIATDPALDPIFGFLLRSAAVTDPGATTAVRAGEPAERATVAPGRPAPPRRDAESARSSGRAPGGADDRSDSEVDSADGSGEGAAVGVGGRWLNQLPMWILAGALAALVLVLFIVVATR